MAGTIGVISSCGATVQIHRLDGEAGGGDYTLPEATPDAIGGVKMAIGIDEPGTDPVTDIESANAAINDLRTAVSQLMQALRNAGTIAM